MAERQFVNLSYHARRAVWAILGDRDWHPLRELASAHARWLEGLLQLADWGYRLELDEDRRRLRVSPREMPQPSQIGRALEVVARVRELDEDDELEAPIADRLGDAVDTDGTKEEEAIRDAVPAGQPSPEPVPARPVPRRAARPPARVPAPPAHDAGDPDRPARRDAALRALPPGGRPAVPVHPDAEGGEVPRDVPAAAADELELGTVRLPISHVTATCGILAVKGAGKSYAAKVIAEELLERGLPFCAIEPLGAWWGLRAAGPGGHPGYPVIIAGGDHGDIALDSTMGGAVARWCVARHPTQLVVDLSHMTPDEQLLFGADFADVLFRENRRAMHVFLDEADEQAMQVVSSAPARRALGAWDRLVRRGRIRGVGITVITQRSAVISKNVLTQVGKLLVLRTAGPQDVDAVERWVERALPRETCSRLLASLGGLGQGEAWLVEPGRRPIAERVQVRRLRTHDSSRTPEVGEDAADDPPLVPVDASPLRDFLEAAAGDAGADAELGDDE